MDSLKILKQKILNILKMMRPKANVPQHEEQPDPSFTFEAAFKLAQSVVEALEDTGFVLSQTSDWDKLRRVEDGQLQEAGSLHRLKLKEIRQFYEEALYKAESLRDELQFVTIKVSEYDNAKRIIEEAEAATRGLRS